MPLVHRDLGYHFPLYKDVRQVNTAVVGNIARSGFQETQYWKRIRCTVNITDDGVDVADDVLGVMVAPHRMIVVAAWAVPTEGTVTANAITYAALTLYNMGRTGALQHTIGTTNTSTVDWTLDTVNAFTLTAYGAGTDVEFESRIIERGEFVKIELWKTGAMIVDNICVEMITKAIEGHI